MDEFDLGSFQGVQDTIDTDDAQPIKQRMRRTLLQFVDEEKKTSNENVTRMS